MSSVGIDVSDNSLKFLELQSTKKGLRIGSFGEEVIPQGIIVGGKIQKGDALAGILAKVKKDHGINFVRATLPEERGYLFELSLPDMGVNEMASTIEFRLEENVPIAPSEAVFGYDLLPAGTKQVKGKHMRQAVVSVFPRVATEAYAKIFYDAGLTPLSLETEPQAITRAVVPNGDMGTYLVVDFGRERSGISIVSGGAVRFATTTDVGGDPITKAFEKHYKDLSYEDFTDLKNTKGLHAVREKNDALFTEQVESVINSLLQHISEHLRYWNTHREEDKIKRGQVTKVLLCGGNANLGGLPERISQELKLPVSLANVWVNTFSIEEYIPSDISFRESLGYAPAIGLALHGIHPVMRNRHMANLLPREHLVEVRHERRNRVAVVSLVASLITILLGTVFLVPSLLLSRTEAVSAERKIELTRTFIAQREESGVLTEVRDIRKRIERLESEFNDITSSDLLRALDRSIPSGVRLFSISYDRKRGDSDSIGLVGNASTRETLLDLTRKLDQETLLSGIELPVSNLARSTNISFSLTLTVPEESVVYQNIEEKQSESSDQPLENQ